MAEAVIYRQCGIEEYNIRESTCVDLLLQFTDNAHSRHTPARMVDRSSDSLVPLCATEIRLYGSMGYSGVL